MKTIAEFIKEINGSEALLGEFKALKDSDAAATLLKKYDVSGTVDDFAKALTAETDGAISDDAAGTAASGGILIPRTPPPWLNK